MKNELESCGKVMRLFISNHSKNKLTSKQEIRSLLSINKAEYDKLMISISEYASILGLEVVGVESEGLKPIASAEKFFVRKVKNQISQETKSASTFEKKLFLIFAALRIEKNAMEDETIEKLGTCKLFNDCAIKTFVKELKSMGYVSSKISDDKNIWSYGWRFYVEYEEALELSELVPQDQIPDDATNDEIVS